MLVARGTALTLFVASALVLHANGGAVAHDPNPQEMDRSIKPGDDFYGYANGGWHRTVAIPTGRAVYDTRALLTERTSQRVRDLIQGAAASKPVKGTVEQKVGDYYASFLDVDAIEAKGMAPLAGGSYRAATAKLKAQLEGSCPLPDLCVNSTQVLSESIADLAGLQVAHDAYVLSQKGKADVVIGGLTAEPRFFLAFAQRWRRTQTEAALRHQLATDTHLPAQYRSALVRNLDAWYKAYQIAPGDKLSLKPDARVSIW